MQFETKVVQIYKRHKIILGFRILQYCAIKLSSFTAIFEMHFLAVVIDFVFLTWIKTKPNVGIAY